MNAFRGRLEAAIPALRQARFRVGLRWAGMASLALGFVLIGAVLIGFDALIGQAQTLISTPEEGQEPVALEDLRAPYSLSYPSQVLTDQARQTAMDGVANIYDPPDQSIARQQIQLARHILDFLADVRADEFATVEQKQADARAIQALALTDSEIQAILNVSPDRWGAIDQQVIVTLDSVMRQEIRDDNLTFIKRNLPTRVSVSQFREDEVGVIVAVVEDLIVVNTFYDEERTRQAKQAAADAVPTEIRSFVQGQLIVRGGDIVTEADMEALIQFGLLQPEDRRLQGGLSAFLIMTLSAVVFGLYFSRFHPNVFYDVPFMVLLGATFLLFLAGARLAGPSRVVQPYLYPSAALGLLLATLVGHRVGILGMVMIAILIGIMANNSLPLAVMTGMGGVFGVLGLRNTERINHYFVAGGLAAVGNIGVVLVFFLTGQPADALGAFTLIVAGLINGVLAATVALAGLYAVSSLFNFTTSLKLIELSQPNHPLLQRLLREAPGTYQHSLQVANLAELAAQRIGANAALTRVGALYHDVGKVHAPHFFVENQADGVNPHDALKNPHKSARIIIEHVLEGERLTRKHRIPGRIRAFVLEHHGTGLVSYFYRQAVERADGDESAVDIADFTYPGPRPQSRETAILMLADGCESAVRARRPHNKQEIADVVEGIFEARVKEGQLNDSGLTLRDLSVIQGVFVESLQGVFHPRIAYPEPPAEEEPEQAVDPGVAQAQPIPANPSPPMPETPPETATESLPETPPAEAPAEPETIPATEPEIEPEQSAP